jgi:hypothetical protein
MIIHLLDEVSTFVIKRKGEEVIKTQKQRTVRFIDGTTYQITPKGWVRTSLKPHEEKDADATIGLHNNARRRRIKKMMV